LCTKTKYQIQIHGSDLYNLAPAIGEINGLRSNYSFALIPGENREFGTCDMEIENRKAEPRPKVSGDIARIYFYINWAYPGHGSISKKNRKLFKAWDKEDPVDAWEFERSKRIEGIQRNENPFVKKVCAVVGKWRFFNIREKIPYLMNWCLENMLPEDNTVRHKNCLLINCKTIVSERF